MKIIYYVTEHGLGHASRTVAIVRDLLRYNVEVIIRNDDPISFFKKSLPKTRVVTGETDLKPIMQQKNAMRVDDSKTARSVKKWIQHLPLYLEKESSFVTKERPDLIVSDISVMPILVAKKNHIRSVAISSFVWNETLNIDSQIARFLRESYNEANLVIKLPFGSPMNLQNKRNFGLVARKPTKKRIITRTHLGIQEKEQLVAVSLSGVGHKLSFKHSKSVKLLDISNYSVALRSGKINFVEGQNLINAADLVICKCGYGFISECLSCGVKFRYVMEPSHKEAWYVHKELSELDLHNRISLSELKSTNLDTEFVENANRIRLHTDNQNVAKALLRV